MPDVTVRDAPAASRYELYIADRPAGHLRYHRSPGQVELVHTEVDPAYEGQGLGRRLAAAALDDARARGERVVVTCPFVAVYVKGHPEYEDLMA